MEGQFSHLASTPSTPVERPKAPGKADSLPVSLSLSLKTFLPRERLHSLPHLLPMSAQVREAQACLGDPPVSSPSRAVVLG